MSGAQNENYPWYFWRVVLIRQECCVSCGPIVVPRDFFIYTLHDHTANRALFVIYNC